MVNYYVKKIKKGQMLWTSVPSLWRASVVATLEGEGFICYSDGTIGVF